MTRASAPAYDRFKTFVAVALGILLLLMLLRGCATTAAPDTLAELAPVASSTALPPTSPPATETVPAASPTASPSPTPLPPTVTPTEAVATAETTAAETPTSTPEPASSTAGQNSSCNTLAPSRLSMGQKARVTQRLNVRNNASITAAIVKVNSTNSQVEIIGGPTCEPVGGHAYLWWQIRLSDGTEGWSAESPLNSAGYFLEPLP